MASGARRSHFQSHPSAAGGAACHKLRGHRVSDQFFHRIAHRTCAETRVLATLHEERQHGFIHAQRVTRCAQKFQFCIEQEPRDFELHVVAEALENQLFIDARE